MGVALKLIRLIFLCLLVQSAHAQTWNYFGPGPSGQVELSNGTAILQAAHSANIADLWIGSGCSGAVSLLLDGTCTAPGGLGTVTSVTCGAGLTGGTITTTGTCTLVTPVAISNGGTGTNTPSLIAGSGTSVTGSWPNQTITFTGAGSGTVTSVTCGTGLSGGTITTTGTCALSTPVAVANGGTGTASPSLIAGSGAAVTGTWPNQTISLTGSGSGTVTSVACGTGLTGGTITTTGTCAFNTAYAPTLSGAWTWQNTASGGITPATATWAESFHLNDQQSSGHSYGDISGYCSGAAAGTWALYDYTANASRICVGGTGAVTIPGSITSNSSGAISVPTGTDAYFIVAASGTLNSLLEENDTGSASPTGMPANSAGLNSTTGNLTLHATAGSIVVAPSAFQSQGLYDYPSNSPSLTVHAGFIGSPKFESYLGFNVSWNGSAWVSGTDGTNNGGALITSTYGSSNICISTFPSTGGTYQNPTFPACALLIDSAQNITTPGAASVPWNTTKTAFGGCASAGGISPGANQGLATCTNGPTGYYNVVFTTSYFASVPRCTANAVGGQVLMSIASITTTGMTINASLGNGSLVDQALDFTCMSTN